MNLTKRRAVYLRDRSDLTPAQQQRVLKKASKGLDPDGAVTSACAEMLRDGASAGSVLSVLSRHASRTEATG